MSLDTDIYSAFSPKHSSSFLSQGERTKGRSRCVGLQWSLWLSKIHRRNNEANHYQFACCNQTFVCWRFSFFFYQKREGMQIHIMLEMAAPSFKNKIVSQSVIKYLVHSTQKRLRAWLSTYVKWRIFIILVHFDLNTKKKKKEISENTLLCQKVKLFS